MHETSTKSISLAQNRQVPSSLSNNGLDWRCLASTGTHMRAPDSGICHIGYVSNMGTMHETHNIAELGRVMYVRFVSALAVLHNFCLLNMSQWGKKTITPRPEIQNLIQHTV